MMMIWKRLAAVALLTCGVVMAQETEETSGPPPEVKQWIDGLKFQTGEIAIGDGVAKATVPQEFKYLNPADSGKYLQLLGNPPSETLGMLFPADKELLSPGWFVVLEYEKDGHVMDDDAAKIDYSDLLKDMKEQSAEGNKLREKEGYTKVDLIGWATQPHYDASSHKLYWAKELQFGEEASRTLNYNIRMLGREGVLVANAVGDLSDLPSIEKATPQILSMVDFTAGNRYEDFNAKTDHTAEYGIAGLIAGAAGLKIAAKTGIVALLLKKAAVFWKLIAVAGVAVVGLFKKMTGGRKRSEALDG